MGEHKQVQDGISKMISSIKHIRQAYLKRYYISFLCVTNTLRSCDIPVYYYCFWRMVNLPRNSNPALLAKAGWPEKRL